MQKEKNIKKIYVLMPLMALVGFGLILLLNRAAAAEPQSPDGPAPWGSEMFISPTSPDGAFVPIIKVAPDSSIMVIYRHQTAGNINNPYFTESSNNGSSWSNPSPIRTTSTDIPQVSFAFDSSSKAHTVYRTDTDIFHSLEDQWPGTGTAIISTISDSVMDPDIDIAPDNTIHVIWAQKAAANQLSIRHAYSTSGGAGWTISPDLSDNAQRSSNPSISVDGSGNVHVVWEERTFSIVVGDFVTEILYKKGTWVGNSLIFDTNPTPISEEDTNNFRPEAVADSNQVHVSYMRQDSNNEQYAMYAKYNGTIWLPPVDTTNNNPVSVNQSDPFFLISTLDVCNNIAYIYYHGALTSVSKEQILGSNSGDNWSFREEVTSDTVRSVNPAVTCVGEKLFMAFNRIEESGPNVDTNQVYFISATGGGAFLPVIVKP